MRDFPQELIDIVLDQLGEQEFNPNRRIWLIRRPPTSIATCGLVCKQWLPRSRLHVFHIVTLYGSRLRSLLDLETGSSVPLLSLIRDLFLLFIDGLTLEDVASLRACLSLTHLEISSPTSGDDVWNSFVRTHLPFLGTHCVSLSSLKLSPCEKSAVPLCMIVDILGCLPSLTSFELEGQSCRIAETPISPSQSCPRHLHTLNLDVKGGADALFTWFLSLAVAPRINSLTLSEDWDDPTPQSLVAYSQRFGDGWDVLDIWPHRESLDGPSGILKHATLLRHLKLRCQPPSSVLTILSAMPCSHLVTLAIELEVVLDDGRVDTVPNMDRVPYASIDKALSHARFHSLRSFALGEYSVSHPARSLFTRKTKALMPLASARRILHQYHN
ncbi:hypothetical protein B0H13DRAFT_2081160 [Mycena leptocephala]|nr:hypothetical protein B0H13DRAFT_2081160 [Mycena leptocephala]